ncbi:glycosyltransferase family 4 protein [Halorhodospira neutriphila]|uniref:Glycosyltransferase family 1 protein n=1 Tax=Halorhodospira neutriphila TaxID=168379 RepID=A0ABS1E7K5_9GAMM|nr:glycosyltransferase family 4 protein [Halorhodospira neutriphila]MBK1726386.1 glycosyltransferase family 1 protein [Halorhodospira neutriphila]
MTETVLFAANRGYALTSSREAIIRRFLDGGWRVILATADDDEARYLAGLGATLEPVTFNRGGLAPGTDWQAWRRMRAIYRRWQPSLAHHFHAKPVMLGTLAARQVLGSQLAVVNTITGLGHAFITGGFAARLAGLGYRSALPRGDVTIFQNRDDRDLFRERGWVVEAKTRLITGSGIDLERFGYVDRTGRQAAPVVIMIGRLLGQKGIPEFTAVARRIRARWPEARFLLAGEEDPIHPDAVTPAWVQEQGGVEYLGCLEDVRPLLAEADLLLFPSYREGTPRAVMEAAASGLPTVAFEVPGVRETVRDGETGYLVPDRDVDALHSRVAELLGDADRRLAMGRAARQLAEEAFDIRAIQEQYWAIYQELVGVQA